MNSCSKLCVCFHYETILFAFAALQIHYMNVPNSCLQVPNPIRLNSVKWDPVPDLNSVKWDPESNSGPHGTPMKLLPGLGFWTPLAVIDLLTLETWFQSSRLA